MCRRVVGVGKMPVNGYGNSADFSHKTDPSHRPILPVPHPTTRLAGRDEIRQSNHLLWQQMAALAAGSTKSDRPTAWLGSAMTGKPVVVLSSAIARHRVHCAGIVAANAALTQHDALIATRDDVGQPPPAIQQRST